MTGSNDYTTLLLQFPPRLIDSDELYWETQGVVDQLLDKGNLTKVEQDYLSLLALLIERYDEEQRVFPELKGVALLKALINELGLKQKELTPIFKPESIVSAVLHGKRRQTVEHIKGLSRYFQLPPHLFLGR